jgi:hypothetical protein
LATGIEKIEVKLLLNIVLGAAVVLISFFATLKLLDYFQQPSDAGPILAVITDGPKNVTTKLACVENPYPVTEPDFHLTACVLQGEGTIPFRLNEKNQIACSKGKEISVFPSGRLRRCWVDAKTTAVKVTGTQQECSQAFIFVREDGYYYTCNTNITPR